MLKLKLQYFGHLMRRVDSLEKTLMLGGIGGRSRRGWQSWMASPTRWMWVWVNSGSWWWTGRPGVLRFVESQRVSHLSDWTELNWTEPALSPFVTINFLSKSVILFLFVNRLICITVFLDSTCKWHNTVFFSHFTQHDNLYVNSCCFKWHYFILFYGWVIFHCIYAPHLLFIHSSVNGHSGFHA